MHQEPRCHLTAYLCAALLWLAQTTPGFGAESANIVQISYSNRHFCAVTTGGELVCWGDNTMGQIGNGKYGRSLPDARVLQPTLIIPKGATAVSAGYFHTCAIVDGMLYCWGSNVAGQIGIGRVDPDAFVVQTAAPAMVISRDVTAVSTGGTHTCAIVHEELQCWGGNWAGQIGIGSLNGNTSKPTVILKGGVTAVAAGDSHTCAVVRNDLWCWGDNRSGQIGNGDAGRNISSPTKVITGGVSAVVASSGNTCAIVRGALLCWGANGNGELAPDVRGNVLTPKQFIAGGVTAVATQGGSFCAVVRGALQCWGYGGQGKLGIATDDYKMRVNHPQELIARGVTAVSVGENGTCVLVNRALRCRGRDPYLDDTIRKWNFASFSDAQGDQPVLGHADADRLLALNAAPQKISDYLSRHRIIFQNGIVYYIGAIDAAVYPHQIEPRAEPTLALKLVAIPLFRSASPSAPPPGKNGAVALAPDAACGREGGRAQEVETTLFYVLAGDRFTNLRDALQGSIPVLPSFQSSRDTLTTSAQDAKKMQDCARHVSAALDGVPYRSIRYTLHGGQHVEVAASLSPDWGHKDNGWVERIEINDKQARFTGYSVRASTLSAMQCGGALLTQWKHWPSPWLELGANANEFAVNSALLLATARDLPAYTEDSLRRAIRAEEGKAGLASPAEARQCLPAVVGERIEILYQDATVQRFSINLPVPQSALSADCEQALVCRPLPEAPHLSVVVHVPSSVGGLPFGVTAPTRHRAQAPDRQEDTDAQDSFGMPDAAGNIQQTDGADDTAAPIGAAAADRFDLAAFIVDRRSGEIHNRYLEKMAYVSAPLLFRKLTLDTGRYYLAPGTRAFGLRAEYSDPNSLSPQGKVTLKLFVRDGDTLRKVVDGLIMNEAGSRWSGACTGTLSKVSRIIDIGPASSHGYADLVVTSTVNTTESQMSGSQCLEKALPPRTQSATLHYDGRQYVIPADLRALP
jgi:hypothetical protein